MTRHPEGSVLSARDVTLNMPGAQEGHAMSVSSRDRWYMGSVAAAGILLRAVFAGFFAPKADVGFTDVFGACAPDRVAQPCRQSWHPNARVPAVAPRARVVADRGVDRSGCARLGHVTADLLPDSETGRFSVSALLGAAFYATNLSVVADERQVMTGTLTSFLRVVTTSIWLDVRQTARPSRRAIAGLGVALAYLCLTRPDQLVVALLVCGRACALGRASPPGKGRHFWRNDEASRGRFAAGCHSHRGVGWCQQRHYW